MKENGASIKENKNPQNEVICFINSIDYINEDISKFNNLDEIFQISNEIIYLDLDLKPYIKELNSRLNDENLFITYEIELFE
jgi:hypothetical protein